MGNFVFMVVSRSVLVRMDHKLFCPAEMIHKPREFENKWFVQVISNLSHLASWIHWHIAALDKHFL